MTQRKQQVIAPEEWDFRSLHKDELYAASEYEHARELVSPAQARKARAWLKLTDKTRAKYVKKSGRRGGQVIDHLWPALSVLSDPEMSAEEMGRLTQSGKLSVDRYGIYGFFPIQINWGQSNKQIIKSLSSWVKRTRPAGVKEVNLRGKATIPNDNSRLKWLGAYRLNASGMNFKTARKHILGHIGPKRKDPHDIIPDFRTPSSWKTAINKANELLSQIKSRLI